MDRNFSDWPPKLEKFSEWEQESHSEEPLRLKKLLQQWDIPVACHMDGQSMCPGRLLFSEMAILILPISPQHSQDFNEIETQDNVFTLF